MRCRKLLSTATVTAVLLATVTNLHAQDCDPVETFQLLADDGAPLDFFGGAVAISGTTAIVGAFGDDDFGSAYLFDTTTGAQTQKLVLNQGRTFGDAVSIMNNIAVVGDWRTDTAVVFEKIDGAWVEYAQLPSNGSFAFGAAIDVFGDTIVVGAPNSDTAYVFRRIDDTWTEVAQLTSDDGEAGDSFGQTVSISGNRIAVGAPQDDDNGDLSGSTYIFEEIDAEWVQIAKIVPDDGEEGDQFGRQALNIQGDTLVVQRYFAGITYVFEYNKNNSTWAERAQLFEDVGFTTSDIDGDIIVTGSAGADNVKGKAYLYGRVDGQWDYLTSFQPAGLQSEDYFGGAVAISGNNFIGAAHGDDDNGDRAGAAYLFDLNCIGSECLDLEYDQLIAGERTLFTITGGKQGARGVTVYGTRAGQTVVDNVAGYCATFGIKGVNQNKIIGGANLKFNSAGLIRFGVNIPNSASGLPVFFQSAQQGTCPDECMSNLVEAVVG